MAGVCRICDHPSRGLIEKCVGQGLSLRDIAEQYGVSKSALSRHSDHVVASVRRSIERRITEREERSASKWEERLEGTYDLARSGAMAAAGDEKNWMAGARFLAVMSKLIETGLEVDGVIGANVPTRTTTTVEQVLVLPRVTHSATPTIETTCELPEIES